MMFLQDTKSLTSDKSGNQGQKPISNPKTQPQIAYPEIDNGNRDQTKANTIVLKCGEGLKIENNECKKQDGIEPTVIFSIILTGLLTWAATYFSAKWNKINANVAKVSAYIEPARRHYIVVKFKNNGDEALNICCFSVLKKGSDKIDQECSVIHQSVNDPNINLEDIAENKYPYTVEKKSQASFALYSKESFSTEKLVILMETGDKDIKIKVINKQNFQPSLNYLTNLMPDEQ